MEPIICAVLIKGLYYEAQIMQSEATQNVTPMEGEATQNRP